jgi:lysophospholipase L1-like esterase
VLPRFAALTLSSSLLLAAFILPSPLAAADTAPLPSSIAGVGDSITQAASSDGDLGVDAPRNSWSTGDNGTVNSHYLRLRALNPAIEGRAYNRSVSGAKVGGLRSQMVTLETIQPDYLTVLIGGNDLCTDTIDKMTPTDVFRGQFYTAMETLLGDGDTDGVSESTNVYVVSIPDVHQLWELFRNNFFARAVWSAGNICQSLLANPTSNRQEDVVRRAAFRQRNMEYNAALAAVCALFSRCHWDGEAVFDYQFSRSDVAGDYFHPSIQGQTNLAAVTWEVGYTWTTGDDPPMDDNVAPTASFTASCTDLSCTFDGAGSSDSDGTIASHAWNFGDGSQSASGSVVSHAYASGGTYTVTLTVTDDDGDAGTQSQSVTVTAPSSSITLSVTAYKVKGAQHADLSWSPTGTGNVDVYRSGALVTTTPNDGFHTDNIGKKGGGSYTYKVCVSGTTTCSNEVTVSY